MSMRYNQSHAACSGRRLGEPVHRILSLFVFVLIWPIAAHAHPFGAEHFGYITRLQVTQDQISIAYRAEIPTNRLMRELASAEEMAGEDEKGRFSERKLDELAGGLYVSLDGERLQMTMQPVEETALGNSRFFFYDILMTAPTPKEGAHTLKFENGNYPDHRSFFSNEVLVGSGVSVTESSLFTIRDGKPIDDRTNAWSPDERDRVVSVSFSTGDSSVVSLIAALSGDELNLKPAASAVDIDPMIALINGELTPFMMLIALFLSMFFGAAHALSPGHGKALVAGYLVGSKGTIKQAVLLGVVVTISHTFSVVLLGGVTLMLTDHLAPETLYPWIELSSGLLVLGLGTIMIRSRARTLSHGHDHDHDHEDHNHTLDHMLGRSHSHGPKDKENASLRDLLVLGISGGLVPCPSALVVLLTAISLHRTFFGLIMVGAFSIGLGGVLVAIAIAVVLIGERLTSRAPNPRITSMLSVGSAVLVTVIGVGITVKALKLLVG
jgi:nickel/cobalt exporter